MPIVAVSLTAALCLLAVLGLLVLAQPKAASTTEAAAKDVVEATVDETLSGWVKGDDGELRYYDPGTHLLYSGWLSEGERTLYIDGETGQAHVGWLALDGKRYWLDDGTRATRGTLLKDQWLDCSDGRFYLTQDGSVLIGWGDVDGIRRYFDVDGRLQVGWVDDGSGKRYWVKPEDGTLASHEWIEIDGVCQAFDDDGSWVTLGDVVPPDDELNVQNMSQRQRAVIDACDTTPWPGKALCAGWVSSVFANAGEGGVGGNACDMARAWCVSDDLSTLKPGMIIAVTSHPRTENGKIWGHVCIYVGNGLIRDSGTYGIRRSALGSWLAWFGASETPKWGWANGIDLEAT